MKRENQASGIKALEEHTRDVTPDVARRLLIQQACGSVIVSRDSRCTLKIIIMVYFGTSVNRICCSDALATET